MKEHLLSLTYYAKVKKQKDGYIVTFRDFDNVFAEGDTLEESLFNAQEALEGVLLVMIEKDHDISLPSKFHKGEYTVPVSPEVAAPALLHILRLQQGKTLGQVAKIMHKPYQQYQRLEHNSNMTLKTLKQAASAMGARVEIRLHTVAN